MSECIVEGSMIDNETLEFANYSLSEYFLNITEDFRHLTSVIDAESGESLTFDDVFRRSYAIASMITQLGCGRGDVIAIVCENCLEYPCILLAAFHLGVTCTCVNYLYTQNELRHAISLSKPAVVFVSNAKYDCVKQIRSDLGFIKTIIDIEANDYKLNRSQQSDTNPAAAQMTSSVVESTDTAFILYSSGSTGLSKGVMHTHKGFIHLLEFYKKNHYLNCIENSVGSGLLPMSHGFGLIALLMCFTQGRLCVIIRRYSKLTFLEYIRKYRINILYLVPSVVNFLSKDPIVLNYDLSCIKRIVCGGDILKVELVKSLKGRIATCKLTQVFGMTELSGPCIVQPENEEVGSIGKLMPGLKAKILDLNDGTPLGSFQSGELCLKGVVLMKGYCQTAEGCQNMGFDSDGWLHCGDVAYYDEDFNFFIVGRIKELIKFKGYQVPPCEIENTLLKLEGIMEVGVAGVPDEEAGELPRAYVVKKQGYDALSENEIQKYVEENLSPPKRLRGGVIFVDELPQISVGKIDRKVLKRWAAASNSH